MVEVVKKIGESYVENANKARKDFPGATVLDLTMGGLMGYLDPGSLWGDIQVPGKKKKALTLMGVWEGLKVFEKKGPDESWMFNEKKVGKVRSCKCYGALTGIMNGDHEVGLDEGVKLFKAMYKENVKRKFGAELDTLRYLSRERTLILLDYDEKSMVYPCSGAEMIKELLEE